MYLINVIHNLTDEQQLIKSNHKMVPVIAKIQVTPTNKPNTHIIPIAVNETR